MNRGEQCILKVTQNEMCYGQWNPNLSVHFIKVFTVQRYSFEQVLLYPHSSLNPMLLVAIIWPIQNDAKKNEYDSVRALQ